MRSLRIDRFRVSKTLGGNASISRLREAQERWELIDRIPGATPGSNLAAHETTGQVEEAVSGGGCLEKLFA